MRTYHHIPDSEAPKHKNTDSAHKGVECDVSLAQIKFQFPDGELFLHAQRRQEKTS
jgi:hypothetical protein